MKKRHFVLILALLGLFLAAFLFKTKRIISEKPELDSSSETGTESIPTVLPTVSTKNERIETRPSIVAEKATNNWEWLNEMIKTDPYFEYKAPISFYGKVVDESGNPIERVAVKISWTDANKQTGASSRAVMSDANGLFSIKDVHGISLSVMDMDKEGYTKSIAQNKFLFKYGWFPDPSYHSPDSNNPVTFVMHKSGPTESLIRRERMEAQLGPDQSRFFPIGSGDIFVKVERLSAESPDTKYWNARVTIPNGSLQLTTEEFPNQAPEDGYTNEFVITNGISVRGSQGGTFYVKTAMGYGKVMIYYIPNMPWIYVESWFNPNPNSRNLEVDPNKIIKP